MLMSPASARIETLRAEFQREMRWHEDRMLWDAMNNFDQLQTQHGELEDLFHEISLAKDVPTRAAILEELASALISHTALEERLLRREVALAPRQSGVWEAWEGRLRVERVIVALAAIDPADATFAAKVASLQDLFEDRIEYEETILFPKLQRLGDGRDAVEALPMPQAGTAPQTTTSLSAA